MIHPKSSPLALGLMLSALTLSGHTDTDGHTATSVPLAIPDDSVLHDPLPYTYCENVNEYVFAWPVGSDLQLYRLRPSLREGYRAVFEQVVAGQRHPWAVFEANTGSYRVCVDTSPAQRCDYRLSAKAIEPCEVLALPQPPADDHPFVMSRLPW